MKTLLYALSAVIVATSAVVADPLVGPQSDQAGAKASERGEARVSAPARPVDPTKSPVSDRAGVKAPERGDARSDGDRYPVSLQRDLEFESGSRSSSAADEGYARSGWGGNDNEG